ncbi:MAG TPA: O-antigen ligase family protein [Propionicimonas sp.]|uniref:O-antigen ligase family protein n=1 Tax=Propionicimonas sp. TaxID=1955623 RepID=UPI002F4207B6
MTVASTLTASTVPRAGARQTHEAPKEPLYVWLFLAGLVFTMFSGNTGLMGLPLSPDRPLFAFAVLLLILDPNRDRLRWRWFYAIAALTILWTAFSWFATGSFTDGLKAFALLDRIIVPLAMFPLGALVFATDHRRELLLRTTALMAIYLGFIGFFEYIRVGALVFPSYIMENLNPSTDIRSGGPWLFPEPLGLVCATAIFLSGLLVRTTQVRLWRIVGILGIFFGFLGSVVCMVRSVWLALIVAGLVVGMIVPRIRRRLPFLLIAAAVVVGIIVFVFPDFRDVLINRITTERSVYDRQNTNVAGLRVIEQFPIFGIGWGEFVHQNVLWVRQADTYPVTTVTIEIHNVFLSRAAETGIPGLLLWLLCFVTGPLLGLLAKPLTASARYWKLAALAAFFLWFMPSLSSPNPYPTPNYLVWLIWGIAARGILVELPTRPGDVPLRADLPA